MTSKVELDPDGIIVSDYHSAIPHLEPLEDSTEPSIIYIEGLLRVFGAGIATYAGDEALTRGVDRFERDRPEYKPHATELVERWVAIYQAILRNMRWNSTHWQAYVGEHIAIADPLLSMELLPSLDAQFPLAVTLFDPHGGNIRITSDFFGSLGYVPARHHVGHMFTPIQAR